MEKQVGLLIMKDENDILHEYLTKITQYFDKILVLDGTDDDEGRKICSNFSEVIFYEKDKNVLDGNVNDSTTRGFLWEQAKKMVDNKLWVGILHPDEFPSGDTLEMLDFVETNHSDAEVICVYNLHFFLHTSQKDSWEFKPGDSIESKMKYYIGPGHVEPRYFRFNKEYMYGVDHYKVLPWNLKNKFISIQDFMFTHKQFSYRTLEQAKKRAKSRWESGWQMNDYLLVLETGDIFFDTLMYPEEYKQKYPLEYETCWYNSPGTYVKKLD